MGGCRGFVLSLLGQVPGAWRPVAGVSSVGFGGLALGSGGVLRVRRRSLQINRVLKRARSKS